MRNVEQDVQLKINKKKQNTKLHKSNKKNSANDTILFGSQSHKLPRLYSSLSSALSSSASDPSASSSKSTTASCLSWYSVIKSRTFLSASWNSISSIPSPLYQCKNAFLLYIFAN